MSLRAVIQTMHEKEITVEKKKASPASGGVIQYATAKHQPNRPAIPFGRFH